MSQFKAYREARMSVKDLPQVNSSRRYAQTSGNAGFGNPGGAGLAGSNVMYTAPQFYSPLHTPSNWQIPVKRREIYMWCRFFMNNEPKIAAALDFYSQFSMNGFINEIEDPVKKEDFDELSKRLRLETNLKMVAYELLAMGDAFPFLTVACPVCNGSGYVMDEKQNRYVPCLHPGGTWSHLTLLDPQQIEVFMNYFDPTNEVITLLPDQSLKAIVQQRKPEQIYNRIPNELRQSILANRPILLNTNCVTHLAYNRVGYYPYGRSMLIRLFPTLAYKDKLRQAQWIVADRHIVPIKVVKVGSDTRPAGPSDIADVQSQLAVAANDPNLTLVTHHDFDYSWVGSSGKILQLTKEYELINQDLLDGMMINEALLNGSGPQYASAAIGIEAMIERLESLRKTMAEWIEEKIYKPYARMKGYYKTTLAGKRILDYPSIKFRELNLRDDTQVKNVYMQLADKGYISRQTLLEFMGIDYNQEIERTRFEQMAALQLGVAPGNEGGPGGDLGGGFLGGGGGGGGDMDLGGLAGGEAPAPDIGGSPEETGAMGGMSGGGGAEASFGAPSIKKTSNFKAVEQRKKEQAREKEKLQQQSQKEQDGHLRANNISSIERELYKAMMKAQNDGQLPLAFNGQYKVGGNFNYTLDAAYPQIKLGVEADGKIWHDNEEMRARDAKRDNKLRKAGWEILRFKDEEIERNLYDMVMPKIIEVAKSRYEKISGRKLGEDKQ